MLSALTLSLAVAAAHALLHMYALVLRVLAQRGKMVVGVGERGGDEEGEVVDLDAEAEEEQQQLEEEEEEEKLGGALEEKNGGMTEDGGEVGDIGLPVDGETHQEDEASDDSHDKRRLGIHDEPSPSSTADKIKINTTLVSVVSVSLSPGVSSFSTSPSSPASPVLQRAEPFVTPSTNYPAHGPYTGVGEKVADFVKKYKEMQAELAEAQQRLEVAEGYKAKYEEVKREMDDILGNA